MLSSLPFSLIISSKFAFTNISHFLWRSVANEIVVVAALGRACAVIFLRSVYGSLIYGSELRSLTCLRYLQANHRLGRIKTMVFQFVLIVYT